MDIKHSFEKLKSVFTSDKKLAVLCAVGVLGVVLLILSEFIPSGEKKAEKKESVTAAQSQETYAEDIEKRLTEIVSSIDGAGKTRVMVTLESGAEQVYAKNEKIKSTPRLQWEHLSRTTTARRQQTKFPPQSSALLSPTRQPPVR